MSARRERWGWMVDFTFRHPSGARERVRRKSPVQTRMGAEAFERRMRASLLDPPRPPVPTLAGFAPRALEHAIAINRPSTVAAKRYALAHHILPQLGAMPLDAIDRASIEAFKVHQIAGGLARKTVNNQLVIVHRMLVLAEEWGFIARAPAARLTRCSSRTPDPLTDAAADALLAHAPEPYRAMMVMALHAGLRIGELRALRREDIDWTARSLMVRRCAGRRAAGPIELPKSGRERIIPLNDTLIATLRASRHLRGPWVYCHDDGSPLGQTRCTEAIRRACARAGIPPCGWHRLRHTFATRLAAAGVPLHDIQHLLGHATIAMTLRYAHVLPDHLRDAVSILDHCGSSAAATQGAHL